MTDVDEPRPVPPRAPTKRYAARRNALIASAVEAVNRRGVRGMTLGEVTAGLNLVPTGVIYYFKNKEELAAEAFRKAIERYLQLLADSEAPQNQAEPVAAFVQGYFAFRQQVAAGQAEQIAVFNDVRALNRQSVNDAYVGMFRRARTLLPGCEGLARHDRNARTHLLLSQMFWIVAWLDQWEPADYPRVAERMTSVLVHGMGAKGRPLPEAQPILLVRDDDPSARSSSELFLTAATQLINDEGYHGASVERISAKLNVSKGASTCATAPAVPDEPNASRQCAGAKGVSASSSSAPAATWAARKAAAFRRPSAKWRRLRLTQPTANDSARVGVAPRPRIISVERPPMSMTRRGSGPGCKWATPL